MTAAEYAARLRQQLASGKELAPANGGAAFLAGWLESMVKAMAEDLDKGAIDVPKRRARR